MLQFYERATPVTLHHKGVPAEEEGQMYVRFATGGVYISLLTPTVCIETRGLYDGHFLDALRDGILLQIPDTTIKQQHSVWFKPCSGARVILRIEEFVSLDVSRSELKFHLVTCWDDHILEGTGSEFDIAMDALMRVVPGDILACYTCSYAAYMSYGNEDLRQGWDCFRDVGVNPSTWERWWDHEEEFKAANHNMSAFHWCTSHTMRKKAEHSST